MNTASVASPARRPLFAVNAGTVLLSKSLDVFILVASAAGVAVGATQIIISMTHVMHLAAGESRAREVFLANITMEWTARDAGARVVHKKIALLSLAAFAADMTIGATKVSILTQMTHVVQLAAGKFCAW